MFFCNLDCFRQFFNWFLIVYIFNNSLIYYSVRQLRNSEKNNQSSNCKFEDPIFIKNLNHNFQHHHIKFFMKMRFILHFKTMKHTYWAWYSRHVGVCANGMQIIYVTPKRAPLLGPGRNVSGASLIWPLWS